jgi:hypothetical protein
MQLQVKYNRVLYVNSGTEVDNGVLAESSIPGPAEKSLRLTRQLDP